jgi:hypothetical protein
MRFLTAGFLLTTCISDVALAGHATPEDIEAAQQRINVLNREITTISQPFAATARSVFPLIGRCSTTSIPICSCSPKQDGRPT